MPLLECFWTDSSSSAASRWGAHAFVSEQFVLLLGLRLPVLRSLPWLFLLPLLALPGGIGSCIPCSCPTVAMKTWRFCPKSCCVEMKKEKGDENKGPVCFFCSSFSHLSRYTFVLVKPSVSKALKISKYFLNLLLQFWRHLVDFQSFELTFWPFGDTCYPSGAKKAQQLEGRFCQAEMEMRCCGFPAESWWSRAPACSRVLVSRELLLRPHSKAGGCTVVTAAKSYQQLKPCSDVLALPARGADNKWSCWLQGSWSGCSACVSDLLVL